MAKDKKYWHELSKDEVKNLNGNTWGYVMDNYKQSDWCKYPGALQGILGCWSLTDPEIRIKISKDFCKNCDESMNFNKSKS